jgi:opacity protein-like surface antigen
MKKLLLLSLMAVAFATTTVSAQTKGTSKFSVGAEFGLPVGDFSSISEVGFGGSLAYQHAVADKLYLTGNAGYLSFTGKDLGFGIKLNTQWIPVKAGAKYFFANNFYGAAELGAVFSAGEGQSGNAFAYAPSLGMEFPVADKTSIDVGVRYEGWANNGTLSFFGLRAALNFGL